MPTLLRDKVKFLWTSTMGDRGHRVHSKGYCGRMWTGEGGQILLKL